MIGMTLFTAVICAYVVSVQQVFGEVYNLSDWMPSPLRALPAG